MRTIALFASIITLCVLTACVTATPEEGTRTASATRSDTYTNASSQFCFPQRVGGFEREKVTQYDRQGQDVGVGYNDSLQGIAVTAFVYPIVQRPPNDTLAGHFDTCKAEVFQHHYGARIVSEEAVQITPGDIQQRGQHATFTYTDVFAGQQQPLISELFLFTHGSRFIMYRATYPVDRQANAEPTIRKFMNALIWPK
jgi:hypothetical protein